MDGVLPTDPWALLAVAVAMSLGGVLKGATGAGLPVLSVPVLAMLYDVRVAVAIMVVPNLITNLSQVYKYRAAVVNRALARNMAIAGGIGVAVGTFALAWLSPALVQAVMVVIILVYVALRLSRPHLRMPDATVQKFAWLAGGTGGVLQGAVGISAPIAVTFLSAATLPRPAFILTVSTFFAGMCVVQLPVQVAYGIMTPDRAVLGLFSLVPLMVALPLGEWIGKRLSAAAFDRIILIFLILLALKLTVDLI